MTIPVIIWALLGIIVVSAAAAFYALQADRARRDLVMRLDGQMMSAAPISILRGTDEGWVTRLGRWLRERAPASWSEVGAVSPLLVQAGFDGDFAPLFYSTIRVSVAVLLPLAAFTLGPQQNFTMLVAMVVVAGGLGVIGPRATLDRLVAKRRDRIRKSIPDS